MNNPPMDEYIAIKQLNDALLDINKKNTIEVEAINEVIDYMNTTTNTDVNLCNLLSKVLCKIDYHSSIYHKINLGKCTDA